MATDFIVYRDHANTLSTVYFVYVLTVVMQLVCQPFFTLSTIGPPLSMYCMGEGAIAFIPLAQGFTTRGIV